MASYVRCLRACVAPFFVVYTILVTYFLAQSAWDDVSSRLRRRNDARFLDVLVQEERRHLRSFQDVVKNYRGDIRQSRDNVIKGGTIQQGIHYTGLNTSSALAVPPVVADLEPRAKVHGRDEYTDENDDEDSSYNETYLPKDLQLEQQAQEHKLPKQVFQVEVEEWDVPAAQPPSLTKTQNNSQETSTRARFEDSNMKNINHNFQNYQHIPKNTMARGDREDAIQSQKHGSSLRDGSYTTEFCDYVFDVFGQKPTICKRELAETSSVFHVNVSTYSVPFRELGEIFIFSAFLDTREALYSIRLMTLGGKDRDNSKSVYWCVFYLRSRAPSPHKAGTSDLNNAATDSNNYNRQSTQLTYYSASDGHNKSHQFYIMSCPVPEEAKSSLLPPHRGLFQVTIGDLQRPFWRKSQARLTLKIIRNIEGSTKSHRASVQHKRPTSANTNKDALTLDELESIGNKPNENGNNIKDNTNALSHVVSYASSTTEIPRTVMINSTDDKIVSCVPPLQGPLGVVQLVEFIELTLLLGSQHIVFYTFQVSAEIKKALSVYEQRGLVTVLPWSPPAPESVWAKGRDMALNDCLYRTMHLFDYALFLDLDEFLVPRVTPDIPSFLKYLKSVHRFNSSKFSDLVFSSTYFPPPTKAQYKNLTSTPDFTREVSKFISLKSIHRTYFNPKHTLRLIKLSKALRVGAGERKRTSFTISSRFAVVHHYSYCPQDASTGSKLGPPMKQGARDASAADICGHTKADFTTWRYKSVLVSRVKDSVIRLNRG